MEKKTKQKKFWITETMDSQLKELAEEKGLSETQVIENAFDLYKKKEDSGKAEKFVMDKFSGLENHLSDVEKRFDDWNRKLKKL